MKIILLSFLFLSFNLINEDLNKLEGELYKVEIITKFNNQDIVYRGITNPIVIKVENVLTYEAAGIGLEKIDDFGNYKLYPRSGKELVIKVTGKQKNGKSFEVSKIFKIKDISSGISQFNGRNSKVSPIKMSKRELSTGRISHDFPNTLIKGLKIDIISFKIKLPGKTVKKVYGNKIKSSLVLQDILKLKRDSKIQIFDIQIKSFFPKNSSLRICKVSPILIKITS